MKKEHSRWLIALVAMTLLLAIVGVIYRYNAHSNSEPTYDIVGTYMGNVNGLMYYVFDSKGHYCYYIPEEVSVVIDEGTYKNGEHNIFTLESTMNQEHIVVCGESGIYDFDMNNKEVHFADKITREIYYVNLPDKVIS